LHVIPELKQSIFLFPPAEINEIVWVTDFLFGLFGYYIVGLSLKTKTKKQ
jgi:hypothetical protein